ncbi:DNA internalization-related competence protein ComEC/Rec2 [Paenibacillus swuensis]|uniref:DNA internalization-related competence protein ComEC/Rec2 n=1 Tax=Paenibacillus swuensis TaxID=1178515 RepID=UPI0009EF213B|nr:DNA internalization-related competence protein ComEC/Rec2 [Paenibacillus swuensis]
MDNVSVSSPKELTLKLRLLRWNDAVRDVLGEQTDRIFHPDQAGFMKSLMLGITEDVDPLQFQQFSKLGLTHILAISGMHVAVFVGACSWLFRGFGLTRERNLGLTFILVPIYVVLSGASPSAIRAGIMAMIALYAAKNNVLKDGLHILCAAALLMLIWNPYYLRDVSFQLSFIVTAGLILWVPAVNQCLPLRSSMLRSSVSITLVAQCVSFPLTVYYFNQFSLLSFAANFVLVPYISFLILPFGTLTLLIGSIFPSAGFCFARMTEKLNAFSFQFVEHLNGFAFFTSIWPKPSVMWILCYYALLAWVIQGTLYLAGNAQSLQTWKRLGYGSLPIILIISLLWLGYSPERFTREGSVHFIDVGQGDCIFIRTPEGRTMLIDGGGTLQFTKSGEEWRIRRDPYEVGRKMLVPLLKQRGIHTIDYVVLSHQDQDHIGGLQAVLEDIPVGNVVFNGTLKEHSEGVYKLFRTAMDKRSVLIAADRGKKLTLDPDTTIEFLFPEDEDGNDNTIISAPEQNEVSLIMLMKMAQSTFLFTGDAGMPSEDLLMSLTPRPPLSASGDEESPRLDVLKIGHHGSKNSTSETWLQYWHPRMAVISAGSNNLYGHPHPDVLSKLKAEGSAVYRTDTMGEIQMRVDKVGIAVRSKLPIR